MPFWNSPRLIRLVLPSPLPSLLWEDKLLVLWFLFFHFCTITIFLLPSSQSAPPLPTGHRHRNPGPALLPKQVPPYLQGFVAQTGRSQRVPVNPGGQLQNQDPLSSCWVHTAPFRHGWVVHTADWHSTTSLPDTASWYRWTSSPYNYNMKNIQKVNSIDLSYCSFYI